MIRIMIVFGKKLDESEARIEKVQQEKAIENVNKLLNFAEKNEKFRLDSGSVVELSIIKAMVDDLGNEDTWYEKLADYSKELI